MSSLLLSILHYLFWYVGGVIGGIGVFQFLQLTF